MVIIPTDGKARLIWVLAATLLWALVPVSAEAGRNAEANLLVKLGDQEIGRIGETGRLSDLKVGEEFTITVMIEGSGPLRTVNMNMLYDAQAFTFLEWRRDRKLGYCLELGPDDGGDEKTERQVGGDEHGCGHVKLHHAAAHRHFE